MNNNLPDEKEYKKYNYKLTPFKLCVLQNFPFIEADFDAINNYQLLCKVVEYLNHVIDNQNTVEDNFKIMADNLTTLYNYIDTLDLQDEVNNKLDEMAESGELTEIISFYLNTKAIFAFNDVNELKQANNLVNGSIVKTLGYYSVNDGGGAEYKIVEEESETDYQVILENGLYANLILKDYVNVKQLGAKGDGEFDNDAIFKKMITLNVDKYIIPYGTYLIEAINFPNNKVIEGNNATLNCKLETSQLVGFGSNSIINNLTINSLNEDREWNRIDFTNKHNIIFNNCTFKGFRQTTLNPESAGWNVWALILKQCHDLSFKNCRFENNSFQDILIEYDVHNILFENIDSNDSTGVYVDIEPSNTQVCNNITFINTNFKILHTYEYYNFMDTLQNISIIDSIIREFTYHGGNITITRTPILNYVHSDFLPNAGNLILNNCVSFGKNLVTDPYFDTLSLGVIGFWKVNYNTSSFSSLAKKTLINNAQFLQLNYNNSKDRIIIQSEKINCSANDIFMITTNSFSNYNANNPGGGHSKQCNIVYYNASDEVLKTNVVSINRANNNEETSLTTQSIIIKIPENCSYFIVQYQNGELSTTFSLNLCSCSINKLTLNNKTNNLIIPEPRRKAVFNNQYKQTNTNYINHLKGDIIYYTEPTTYIGAVCTEDGNVWNDFGAIN